MLLITEKTPDQYSLYLLHALKVMIILKLRMNL